MRKFEIEIVSVLDRNKLVAEIWYEKKLIAEINQETESLEIELYAQEKVSLNYDEFLKTLEVAKNRLREES